MTNKGLIMVLALLILSLPGFATSVSFNLKYAITDNADTISAGGNTVGQMATTFNTLSKTYLASERSGAVAGLISGGSFVSAFVNSTSTPYLFQMTQQDANNKALIFLTKGSLANVNSAYDTILDGVITKSIGAIETYKPSIWKTYLQLRYTAIDLISDTSWTGSRNILVKNEGRDNGRTKVSIEVVG